MTSKLKPAAPIKPVTAIEWTGLRTERIDYEPGATIFAQGDPATSVMYVDSGAVRLSVLSHAGKEAVIAVLDVGHFFGEGRVSRARHSEWPPRWQLVRRRSRSLTSRIWSGTSTRTPPSRIGP
jgi:CRP-like cAMP-binding protein